LRTIRFQIVIEAYNFTLDAFGKQGGAVIIDDIIYNSTAIYGCRMVPHYKVLPDLSRKACSAIQCDFDKGSCLRKLEKSGWRTADKPVGSRSSGIRRQLSGLLYLLQRKYF
uniref:PIP49_C domain-containing protein n=1 Tax=Angiostrongylus cantonensis TaxID=6313 RepID=A0A0K0DNL8_ANGCA